MRWSRIRRQRKQAVAIGYIFAAGIGMLLLQWVLATYNTVDTIPYSQFEQLVAQGKVTEVAVGQDTIQGKLKDKLPSGKSAFVTARVDPGAGGKARGQRRRGDRRAVGRAVPDHSVLGRAGRDVLPDLGVPVPAAWRIARALAG